MVKKKKQKKQQPTPPAFSPKKYIQEKGRLLPILTCWVGENWEETGLTYIIVVRQHKTENYTLGAYLVDTYCLGLKDSFFRFNIDEEAYLDVLHHLDSQFPMKEVPYVEAHNLIYGAIAFAEDAGIQPHKSFAITQYLLEEDTEDIPLLDIPFGKDGKYFLVAKNNKEQNTYLPILKQNLRSDEFMFDFVSDDEYDDDGFDPQRLKQLSDRLEARQNMPKEKYTYQHGEYPTTLQVKHQQLVTLFYDPKYAYGLPDDTVQEILNLPHEELRHDIEQICLYETGCTCDTITDEMWNQDYHSALIHSLFFLGELKNPDSLPVVLEMLKQNESYYGYHFGDLIEEAFIPTLYLLGHEQLECLMDYMRTPGLYPFARMEVSHTAKKVAQFEPNRRMEVIDWFRRLLQFYLPNLASCHCCDGGLIGMITSDIQDIQATELLPEIKALYDTGLVDEMCCGNYRKVEKEMTHPSFPYSDHDNYALTIFERYQQLKEIGARMLK